MNFFEQQARARRQTRWLVGAFALAVVAIVLAMNLVALVAFGRIPGDGLGWFSPAFWQANLGIVAWTSGGVLTLIALASLFRAAQLRGGGSVVAMELGGVPVDGSTTDPLRRRLLNVVEEMAIASGVPVPQVFVLEHEEGINAFAAGWSPSDAAVAVTRGTLETLNREELQGVIAHEFSHVFNGDMRLNIRLMGILFGILIIAVIGRKMFSSMRYTVSRNRRNNGGAIILVAVAVMLIGYIGLFFGRWIQAAVSRQREYLADASAVQFTRSPGGIAGALKKIGARANGSQLIANTDEIGHMLFASALSGRLLATHPPLVERIQKIEPSFQPEEFKTLAREMAAREQRAQRETEKAAAKTETGALPGGAGIALPEALGTTLGDAIGVPALEQLLVAGALMERIPEPLIRSAHSDEGAVEAVLMLLLDVDPELRERQLLAIASARGSESEARVRELESAVGRLAPELRLPLLELSLPVLRRRPEGELVGLMRLVDELVMSDGGVSVFEYVLARLLNREIERALQPSRTNIGGRKSISALGTELETLVRILASKAHPQDAQAAEQAVRTARRRLGLAENRSEVDPDSDRPWHQRLDEVLARLFDLRLEDRAVVVEALLEAAAEDGHVGAREYEFLRLVAGLLEIPLPVSIAPKNS